MAIYPITSSYPASPAPETYAPARPVAGRTMINMLDRCNWLGASRGLNCFSVNVDGATQPIAYDLPSDASIKTPIRAIFRISPWATSLYLGFWHIALEGAKGGTLISPELWTLAPALIAGTTRTWYSPSLACVEAGVAGISVGSGLPAGTPKGPGNEGYVYTDWATDLIDVSALRGTFVELRVALSSVRVYSIDVVEIYSPEVVV